MRSRGWLAIVLAAQLSGCASYWAERKADNLIARGETGQGIGLLQDLAAKQPDQYRLKYIGARDKATRELLHKAELARFQGHADEALAACQEVLRYDPRNAEALHGLELIARDQREREQLAAARTALDQGDRAGALRTLGEILLENPNHTEARQLRQQLELEDNRALLAEPTLKASLKKPVSLEFRNASLQAVFEVLSQSSGISFIFDRDVKPDLKTTLYARDTSVEDALNLILRTNQLNQKVLNDSTLLIYPASADKEKQYEDLVLRTFYLGSADPKKVQEMVRTLVAPKAMYVDDKLKMLVVRDNLSVIETVERLINAYDLADPEVVLEVEIMEVNADDSLTLGVQYPDQVKASVFGAAKKAGQLTVDEVRNLKQGNFQLFFPDPLAVLNLKQTSSKAKTLANPRIRVSNHEKAKVLVGDKVPVITTTVNQTSSASSESVSYLDVGLKLEVQPEIHVNNDVSIDINLEVSNIVKEIKSSTGLLTYQIGTRNANTTLRLRDGETQVLAGLIKDEQHDSASHLPGLGKIPLLGRLFSNTTNASVRSEIVLLITPHVVKSLETPAAHVLEFSSGTGSRASTQPLRLTPAARYSNADARLMKSAAATPDAAVAGNSNAAIPAPGAGEGAPVLAPGLRLDMVSPAQVGVDKDFTVALMLNGRGFESLAFDLAFDQPGLELQQATPVAAVAGLDVQQDGQVVHVRVGQLAASSGPLVMLTFKPRQAPGAPVTLLLRSAVARRADDAPVAVGLPAPRQLQVAP